MPHYVHAIGLFCIALAAVLYAIPLQRLLGELARKKDEGGGAIAGALILAPMWALLLIGVLTAIASGGLDALHIPRFTLYVWLTVGTLALAVVSFISLMLQTRPTWTRRVVFGLPLYAGPLLTIVRVAAALIPSFGARAPLQTIQIAWAVLAAICFAICAGWSAWQLAKLARKHAVGFATRMMGDRELDQRNLERMAAFDPERDFDELLGLANSFNSREVREQALARMRSHPDFLARFITALQNPQPDKALALLEWAELSGAERQRLASCVRDAAMRYAQGAREELRYANASRRKLARRWGRHLLRSVAKKFSDTGEDFSAALTTFETAFDPQWHDDSQ